jgi:hypothetical protein
LFQGDAGISPALHTPLLLKSYLNSDYIAIVFVEKQTEYLGGR